MTVVSSSSRITFAGDGVQNLFDFNFRVFKEEDLSAVVRNSRGEEIQLSSGSDFKIVSGIGNDAGGRVQYPVSGDPLAAGESITLFREIPYSQELELVDNDPFSASLLNEAFDRGVMRDQQLQEQIDRVLKYDISTPAEELLSPQEFMKIIIESRDTVSLALTGAQSARSDAQTAQGGAEKARTGAEGAQLAAENARDSARMIAFGDLAAFRSTPPNLEGPAEASEGVTVTILISDHAEDGMTSYDINVLGFGVASISGNLIQWTLESLEKDSLQCIEVIRCRRGEIYSETALHKILVKKVLVQDGPTIVFADTVDGWSKDPENGGNFQAPVYSGNAENIHQIVSAQMEIAQTSDMLSVLDGTTASVLKVSEEVVQGDELVTDQGGVVAGAVTDENVPASINVADSSSTWSISDKVATKNTGSYSWGSTSPSYSSGKRYLEVWSTGTTSASYYFGVGVCPATLDASLFTYAQNLVQGTDGIYYYMRTNPLTDKFMVALDVDDGKVWFGSNGTWNTGDPSTGTDPTYTFAPGQPYKFLIQMEGVGYEATAKTTFQAVAYLPPTGFSNADAKEYIVDISSAGFISVPAVAAKKSNAQLALGAGITGEHIGVEEPITLGTGSTTSALVLSSTESIKDKIFVTGGLNNNINADSTVVDVASVSENIVAGPLANVVPAMTSNTTDGFTVISPTDDADDIAMWNSCDGSAEGLSVWYIAAFPSPLRGTITFDKAYDVVGYRIRTRIGNTVPTRMPKDWTVRNQADAIVDTRSGEIDWLDEWREYIFSTPQNMTEFTLDITSVVNSTSFEIGAIEVLVATEEYTTTVNLVTPLAQVPTTVAIPDRYTLTPAGITSQIVGAEQKVTAESISLPDNSDLKRLAMAVKGPAGTTFKSGKIYIMEKP
ncbi:hypothetical protein [Maridesulfovibrio hydrothermalis]|uniref:B30.2/SPRY domain-containing protein n=1 Tax=Maridesulfovibrio hydrothermalis AM13 = DSM 14728 TaxID=1121451 RepID=L0RE76_9BACT|nr:hypothetical protein [Maridesulfovibrio hydrothermalis]CCO25098.1 protein of unknown function [Maridesulfovibrio hydrothermalis AM13 = DSM 14728]